jgi:hypothetical protein
MTSQVNLKYVGNRSQADGAGFAVASLLIGQLKVKRKKTFLMKTQSRNNGDNGWEAFLDNPAPDEVLNGVDTCLDEYKGPVGEEW